MNSNFASLKKLQKHAFNFCNFKKAQKLWRYVLQADQNAKIMKMVFASSKNIHLFFIWLKKLKKIVLEAKKPKKHTFI